MHNRTKTVLASVGVAALIVVGTDAMTYAGTGDSLILGHGNKSAKTTHIKTTGNGPALSLHAKGKRPALAVDSKAKIVRLNADRVDGKSAAALQNRGLVYTTSEGEFDEGRARFRFPTPPKGTYLVSYSVFMEGASGTDNSPGTTYCYLQKGNGPVLAIYTTGVGMLGSSALSGSSMWTTNGDMWALDCGALRNDVGESWSVSGAVPVTISFLRIDKKTSGHLTS